MRKAVLPRIFAAVASVVITLGLFEEAARMGQSTVGSPLASALAPMHVAVVGR
jgi:hypothetical protein